MHTVNSCNNGEVTSTVKTSTSTTTTQSVFVSLLLNKPHCGCEVIVLNPVKSKKSGTLNYNNLDKHPPQISPPSLT